MKVFWMIVHLVLIGTCGILIVNFSQREPSLEVIQRMLGFLAVMGVNMVALDVWLAPRSKD